MENPRHEPVAETLIYLGRLVDEKRVGLAMRAFDAFADNNPTWVFKIYGDGPLEQDLSNLITQCRHEDHIRFMGRDF